jgi:hypothetical protein
VVLSCLFIDDISNKHYNNTIQATINIEKVSEQLEILWQVWRGLGLFSEGSIQLASIEEALFGLCVLGRYDQRLYDEALSFLITYPDYLLKNKLDFLFKIADETTRNVFTVIIRQLSSTAAGKRLQLNVSPAEDDTGMGPFFISLQSEVSFTGREPDGLYAECGWLRNHFVLSSNVPSLSTVAQVNPWIRAKLLIGNTSRADIIPVLFTGKGTAPEIARKTGCSQKEAWNILTDLEHTGLAASRAVLNKREFRMSERGLEVLSFLNPGKKSVSHWREWRELGYYLHYLTELPEDASKELVASEEVRVREIVDEL